MNGTNPSNESELAQMDEQLKKLESEFQQETAQGSKNADLPPGDDHANKPGDRAPEDEAETVKEKAGSEEEPGAPSEAEKAAAKEKADAEVKAKAKSGEKTPEQIEAEKAASQPAMTFTPDEEAKFKAWIKAKSSKYEQDNTKRLIRWDKIKEEEARLNKTVAEKDAQLKREYARFTSEVTAFRAEKEASQITPEKWDKFGSECAAKATIKEAEAITLENAGELDKAEQARDEAKALKRDAANAKNAADIARKNPPKHLEAQKAQFVKHQEEWVQKAGIDFPEFGKEKSPVQTEAVEFFKRITAETPAVAQLPGFIYFCAERAALKTAADRVPALTKELAELKARVKELDELTSPTPRAGGELKRAKGPKKFEELSDEEQLEQLRAEAANVRR